MTFKKVTILGIPFINLHKNEFVDLIHSHIKKEEKTFIVTANPEIVMKANEDSQYMDVIQQATYVTPDGIGVVKAAKLLGSPLPERIAGYDLMLDLLKLANEHRYSIYLLGATANVLEKAKENIAARYPKVRIIGSNHGFFDWDNNQIAHEVQTLQPDLTFVALGMPRQELWIGEQISHFQKGIFMGVGGSFDVLAGAVERAPEFWQKANLEWFYRLMKQPSRWRRMIALPRFVCKIIGQKVKGKQ